MRKKQAVIIFSTTYLPLIGGAELAIKEITDRIHDLDFFLVTARMKRSFPRRECLGNINVHRVGCGAPFFDKLFSPLLGAFVARKLMKKYDVICFWSMMVTFASGAPFLLKVLRLNKKIPILLTLQEGDSPKHIGRARFGLVALSWRLALRFADHVQVISNYLADMARVYGYKGEISVVPNGAYFEKVKNQNTKLKTIDQKSKIVITVSRLVEKNGVDILIDAIAKVKEHIPDIQCWILGDGPERKNIESRMRNYELGDNVKLFGSVPYEEVPDYLAQADIFVRPSRSEGLGTAFLEAMAAGLPIVGTPVGGIPDFLTDGETGLFARVDDANDCAGKIEYLLRDDALRKYLAENGELLVEKRYNWDRIASVMNDVFCKMKEKAISRHRKNALFPRVIIATGIYPPDIGGPATYSKTIAEEFVARGLNVTIVTYGYSIPKEIQKPNFKIYRISRELPKGLRHLMYFFTVLLHGRHADIIYAQQPVSEGLPAMIAAKILSKKFVLKVVGDYAWEQGVQRFGVADSLDDFLQKRYGWRVEFFRAVESFVARRAGRVIVPSNYLAGVVAQWGVPQENIYVIPNAVEISDTLPGKEEARRMLGLSLDAKIIVSAGRLVPWKGFGALIESMSDVIRHEPTAKLVIIGSGPEQPMLETRITRQELRKAITLIGSLSHEKVLMYLRAADVFALNTAYEGFSHQLIEAMAMGTPVVTTLAGGNAEIAQDGHNALVVPYNDGEKITQAIVRVVRESVLRETLAENGRKTAAQFTKQRMIKETLKVIEVEPR